MSHVNSICFHLYYQFPALCCVAFGDGDVDEDDSLRSCCTYFHDPCRRGPYRHDPCFRDPCVSDPSSSATVVFREEKRVGSVVRWNRYCYPSYESQPGRMAGWLDHPEIEMAYRL